jgi:hypothetical protein
VPFLWGRPSRNWCHIADLELISTAESQGHNLFPTVLERAIFTIEHLYNIKLHHHGLFVRQVLYHLNHSTWAVVGKIWLRENLTKSFWKAPDHLESTLGWQLIKDTNILKIWANFLYLFLICLHPYVMCQDILSIRNTVMSKTLMLWWLYYECSILFFLVLGYLGKLVATDQNPIWSTVAGHTFFQVKWTMR